jgi:chitodextrinase
VALVLALGASASGAPRDRTAPSDRTPPSTPTNLRVTALTQTSATIAWDPSTDNVGVRSYSLWAEGLSGVQSVLAPQTTATWAGLQPGTAYTFRVSAFDAQYNASSPSAPLTVTTPADTAAPSTPSGLSVEDVTASTVLLRWTRSADDLGPVTHEILVNGVPTGDAVSTTPPGVLPKPSVEGAWVRQLSPSTNYVFTVRARDGAGNVSAPSNTVTATTGPSSDTVAPTTPTLTRAHDGGVGSCPEELWLWWTQSTDDVETAATIEYEVRVNGLINEVVPGGTQTITYTEVLGANVVTIVAVDKAGNASAPSNAITVHTNWGSGC